MKKASSSRWLKEHFSDAYVKKSQREGYRARSVYKLKEINDAHHIIKSGNLVIDIGAAPGGWSEYIAGVVGKTGRVIAIDILPMKPVFGVEFIQGDFTKGEVLARLHEMLGKQLVDVVLSDMAPNMTGVKLMDQMLSANLSKIAMDFSHKALKNGGSFLLKAFHGPEFESFLSKLRSSFSTVKIIKPDASRARSSEVYILARGFKNQAVEEE